MAKIVIAGDAVVITSDVKLEDLKMIKKFRPEALTLCGGEDNKDEVFKIIIAPGSGTIGKYGAEFADVTHDTEGRATITRVFLVDPGIDVKDFIADELGGAITALNQLEGTLPAVIEEISQQREAVISAITVA